jgi:hypothetical protein
MQAIFIKGRFPGLNEMTLTARGNKFAAASQKKEHTARVAGSCAYLRPVKKADFVFTWHEKDKRRNPDNIAAAKKYIFDGLQQAKIIKNDGWKEILSFKDQFVVSEIEGVLIQIYEK